jgi:MoaA/NifB/PqqE/SkfB family radical SAM enzyme
MGASDMPRARLYGDVPQEIVCVVSSGSPNEIQRMADYLKERGFSDSKVVPQWDTWRGVTFSPTSDGPPWTQEDFNSIKDLLEKHPNTICVDVSPGPGSAG